MDLLRVWADNAATRGSLARDAFSVRLKREISVTLLKGMLEYLIVKVPFSLVECAITCFKG